MPKENDLGTRDNFILFCFNVFVAYVIYKFVLILERIHAFPLHFSIHKLSKLSVKVYKDPLHAVSLSISWRTTD